MIEIDKKKKMKDDRDRQEEEEEEQQQQQQQQITDKWGEQINGKIERNSRPKERKN